MSIGHAGDPITSGNAEAAAPDGPTIASYFRSFAADTSWDELCRWPPDVFALANVVLDQTEAYRFAVAPPAGRRWPPWSGWNEHVAAAANEWRETARVPEQEPPACVHRHWDVVVRHLDTPLRSIRLGRAMDVADALLTLHAMADEACRGLTSAWPPGCDTPFERRAWTLLEERGSFSRIDPARIRITPKTHFAPRGITIRSFSRYLALNYEAVEVNWRRIEPARWQATDHSEFNIVLLPWPLEVRASAFHPVSGPLENMDHDSFGFFEFDPRRPIDLHLIERLLIEARRRVGRVHAVILPEDAAAVDEVAAIEELLAKHGVLFLVTGARERSAGECMGRNFVHLGARTRDGWEHYRQAKHHRWCLDEAQIRQYHLSGVLAPSRTWWEAIDLPVRTVQIMDIGGGATIAPLVCEDLARLDEVADVLRRAGPSLVITLLLDGPQLPQRWASRYATVLADDPGSAVLTLTSFGMASRSRPAGARRSRAVALWSEPGAGLRQLELGPGASGIAITVAVQSKTVWTADGRRHERNTPAVTLRNVQQLRTPTREEER
ncbi:MAG: hypothetical protein EHM57_07760, partial [Actinobacteria bacterium]